jgi:hypothetical protein
MDPKDPPTPDPKPGDPAPTPAPKPGDPAPTPAPKPNEETFDRAYVERLRREKADAEKVAKDLKDAEAERERKDLEAKGEIQKLLDKERKDRKAEADRFNEQLSARDKRVIQTELKAALAEAGIIDTDLVRLVDMDIVKMNDSGEVEGVKAAVEALKIAKPNLFKAPSEPENDPKPNDRRTVPPRQNGDPKPVKDARELSQEDFDKLWKGNVRH